jgi:NTP pyrophosphatase (non-canonical NTP hydrolase)
MHCKTTPLRHAMTLIDIKNLQQAAAAFGEARDWGQYHSPKNLAMALSVEVAELVEIFQWKTEDEAREIMSTDEREHVEQELADITIYLAQLLNALNVDLDAAVQAKMKMNALKYPVKTGGAG